MFPEHKEGRVECFQSITYTSIKATQSQTISINLVLAFGLMGVELASIVKDEELLILIEYRAP